MAERRGRAHLATTIAAGAAMALGLLGCGANGDGAAAEPTGTASPGDTGSPSAPAPTSAPSASEASPTGTAGEGPDTCASESLDVTLGRGDGAAGTVYRPLEFTNTGDTACVLVGYPGVSYVTEEGGDQIGAAAAREGEQGPAVTLHPGDTASATVGFTQVANYAETECDPVEIGGLRVYPPGENQAVFVEAEGRGCADPDVPGDQLTVTSVQEGGTS